MCDDVMRLMGVLSLVIQSSFQGAAQRSRFYFSTMRAASLTWSWPVWTGRDTVQRTGIRTRV